MSDFLKQIIGCGEWGKAILKRNSINYSVNSVSSLCLVRLDEQFFSGAVEIFLRQRCLSPPIKKLTRTPMTTPSPSVRQTNVWPCLVELIRDAAETCSPVCFCPITDDVRRPSRRYGNVFIADDVNGTVVYSRCRLYWLQSLPRDAHPISGHRQWISMFMKHDCGVSAAIKLEKLLQ